MKWRFEIQISKRKTVHDRMLSNVRSLSEQIPVFLPEDGSDALPPNLIRGKAGRCHDRRLLKTKGYHHSAADTSES